MAVKQVVELPHWYCGICVAIIADLPERKKLCEVCNVVADVYSLKTDKLKYPGDVGK